MADFPSNRHEMVRANYRKTGDGLCKGCGAVIEWWKTTNNKSIPMNPIRHDHEPAETHWSTCPNAKQFKGNDATPPKTSKFFGPSQETEVRDLRDKHDARVVVMIDQHGTTAAWAKGISGEDLRHDLISAGNFVRNEMLKKDMTHG